jgi:hypothetical protein
MDVGERRGIVEHWPSCIRRDFVNIGVTMPREVLEDKIEEAQERLRLFATWNTRRPPTRLTPGWTNRLYVACDGRWVGYFPLSGDVMWNPEDESAPIALIFDASQWRRIKPVTSPRFLRSKNGSTSGGLDH